jgi:hypothetical protein
MDGSLLLRVVQRWARLLFPYLEFCPYGVHLIALTSLLLTYVQICGTVSRVVSNKPAMWHP